jgi:hypothetical protein
VAGIDEHQGRPGFDGCDPGLDGLPHLRVPRRGRVHGTGDLPDRLGVGLGQQRDEAFVLAGEVLVEGSP